MATDRIQVEITGDSRDLQAAAAAAVASIKGVGAQARVTDRDIGASSRGVTRYGTATRGARRDSESLAGQLLRLKLVAGALAFIPAAQGLSALSAGAVAATASLGPLAGSLAAIPALSGTAAQGIATLLLATNGVGDAIGAGFDAQASAASDAADALDDTAQKAEQAADAERALEDANRQSTYAQESLTQARRDARRELVDLEDAAARGQLSQERARLSLRRAEADLRRAYASPLTSDAEIADMRLQVNEAAQDLDEARTAAHRATRDNADAQRAGVRGMPAVIDARRALAGANRQVADAERQAQRAQNALAEGAGKAAAGVSKLEEEMGKLSPEARAFARQIIALRPEIDELRAAAGRELFPGLGDGIREAQVNLPVLERLLEQTGGAIGQVLRDAGELAGSDAFGRDLAVIGERNARWTGELGEGLLDVGDATRHLVVASGPFVDWLVASANGWAEQTRAAALAGRQTGDTADFLDRTRIVMSRLASITGSVADGLLAVGHAGVPLGDDMWRAIDRSAQRFEDWAESTRGQRALAEWFEDARDVGRSLDAALDQAVERFQELRGEGRSSFDALAIAGSELFAQFLTHATETLVQRAPGMAEAFVHGWMEANVWGRLLVGGWLLSRLGGLGRLRALGAVSGGAFGGGFATASGKTAGVGFRAGLMGFMRANGPAMAASAALIFGPEIQKAAQKAFDPRTARYNLPKSRGPGLGAVGKGLDELNRESGLQTDIAKGLNKIGLPSVAGLMGWSKGLAETESRLRKFGDTAEASFRQMAAAGDVEGLRKMQRELRSLSGSLDGVPKDARKAFNEFYGIVNQTLDRTEQRARDEKMRILIAANLRSLNSAARGSLGDLLAVVRNDMGAIEEMMDRYPEQGRRAMQAHFRGAVRGMGRLLRDGKVDADTYLRQIRRLAETHSKGSRENIAQNFQGATAAIRASMRANVISTKDGLAMIRKLTFEALKLYGFSEGEARKLFKAGVTAQDVKGGKDLSGALNRGPQGLPTGGGHATGSWVGAPGARGADTVHARVAAGEFVANSHHQVPIQTALAFAKAHGVVEHGSLQELGSRVTRRHMGGPGDASRARDFAAGGYVQGAQEPSGPGSEPIRALNRALFARGFSVTSGGEYRGSGTFHDQQKASDFGDSVNDLPRLWSILFPKRAGIEELYGPSAFAGLFERGQQFSDAGLQAGHEDHIHVGLLRALSGALGKGGALAGGAMAEELKRVVIGGPDSAMKSIAQTALDGARAAAQQRVNDAAASMATAGGGGLGPGMNLGGTPSPGSGAATRAQMVGWATEALHATGHGASPEAIEKILTLAMKESSWIVDSINNWDSNAAAGNPSGGLMHVTIDKVGGSRARLFDPVQNMIASINYQYARYGGLITHSPYAAGGFVGGDGGSIADVAAAMFAQGGFGTPLHELAGVRGGKDPFGEATVGRPGGRFPSRGQIGEQSGAVNRARGRWEELRDRDTPKVDADPEKEKDKRAKQEAAREKLDRARKAARKDLGSSKRKLGRMRRQRKRGLGRQERRQGRLSGLLEGMGLPEKMVGQFDRRAVDLEDLESLYSQAEARYRAEERVTPETLAALLGPGMGGLSAEDQKELIGSTESILTPAELNDLLARQGGLLAGYEGQRGLAGRLAGSLEGREGALAQFLASMRDRVKRNMGELQAKLAEIARVRRDLDRAQDRVADIRRELSELGKKKKPTRGEAAKMARLDSEQQGLRARTIPGLQGRLQRLGARVPVLEADNRYLTGVPRPGRPGEGTEGLYGQARELLTGTIRPRLDDAREELRPGGLSSAIEGAKLTVDSLKLEGAWAPRASDPAGASDATDSARADLLAQQLEEVRRDFRVSQAQYGVLENFRPTMDTSGLLPYLGRFAQGTGGLRVGNTGMAMLHRDEMVVPDPRGPYGTQTAGGPGAGGPPAQVQVALEVRTDEGQQVRVIDARIDQRAAPVVSQQLGRRRNQFVSAPGAVRPRSR